jgi:MFS family permease
MAQTARATELYQAMRRGRVSADSGSDHRWLILSSALLVQITTSVVTQAFPALAPFAQSDLGLNTAEIGLFATILNLGTMIALLPAGWAVDVLGERRVLVVGGVVTGALTILASFAPNFAILLPMLIVVGIAAATPTPAGSTAIITAFARRDRGFVMSIRQTGIPVGGAVAALVLPLIAVVAGWRTALQVAAGAAVVGAVTAHIMIRRTPKRPSSAVRGQPRSLRSAATRDATLAGLAAVFLAVGQFVLASYIALYLFHIFHLSLTIGSLFLVAANVAGALGRIVWGIVSDRLFGGRRAATLIVVSLLSASGFALLAWIPATTPTSLLITLVLLLGGTVIGWNGVYITLLSELAPADKRGRTVAYGMTIAQVGIFAGPFAFGILVERAGSYRVAWVVVAAALVVPALILRKVREPATVGRTRL